MKTKTLIAYWCLVPLILVGYIFAMATVTAKDHDAEGPKAYASPNGNAWGFQHGRGQPDKTP